MLNMEITMNYYFTAILFILLIMDERFCKKCDHLCHCIEADHSDCQCENCECGQKGEDKTYE